MEFDTLVISSGGILGFALLGALQYYHENNMLCNISTYAGSSIGSIISYLLSIGYQPIELVAKICTSDVLEKLEFFDVVKGLKDEGALDYTHINKFLEKLTLEKVGEFMTLESLKEKFNKRLILSTFNYSEYRGEYLTPETHPNIPALTALRMSANVPICFGRFTYTNSIYVDGAISDSFPVSIIDDGKHTILGIYIIPNIESKNVNVSTHTMIYNLLMFAHRRYSEHIIKNVSDKCTLVGIDNLNFQPLNFNIDTKDCLDLFSAGYSSAKDEFQKRNFNEKILNEENEQK